MFTDYIFSNQLASVSNIFTNITFALDSFTMREATDILIVSLIIYVVLLFVKQTRSYFLVGISLLLVSVSLFSQNLNLSLTRSILQPLSTLTFIIIAIVFQREIRKFFKWILTGQKDLFSRTKNISKGVAGELSDAIMYMSENKIGAIFVFPGKQEIDDIIEGGQMLDGKITKELLLSIFDKNSAGHDGAVIIENDLVKMFGVHLPLARDFSNFRKVGTRHRASAGITEDTDAVAIAISEERGTISMYENGKSSSIGSEAVLRESLKKLTGETDSKHTNFWQYFFVRNFWPKVISVAIASILWLTLYIQTGVIKKEFSVPLSFQLLPSTLEIDNQTSKRQVDVILQGKSRDINLIDGTKLEVRIDARDFKAGNVRIPVTNDMINVPSFITVSDINPESISVIFRERPADSESAQ